LDGKKVSGSVEYLSLLSSLRNKRKFAATRAEDLLNQQLQLEALQYLSVTLLIQAAAAVKDDVSGGSSPGILYRIFFVL
jgi:hypothetical protein